MKLQIFLICSLSLRIQSQRIKPTERNNGYQQYSDVLFFTDNLPSNSDVKNENVQRRDESQGNTQLHAANDSYLRAQQAQQNLFNQNLNQKKILNYPSNQNYNQNQNEYNNNQFSHQSPNINYLSQPSPNVLPPLYNSQDWYNYNTRQNVLKQQQQDDIDGTNRSSEINVIPLTQRNATQDDLKKASMATSLIGINMIQRSAQTRSNVVVSPFSIVSMLALLQAGATGETQRQVTDVLRMTPEMSAAAFHLMNDDLRKRGADRNVLNIASSIFAADAFELGREFKNSAIQNFGSEVSKISFADSNVAAQKINGWIARKTNDQINNVVSPDSVDINTQLVLANAIYFKGLWKTMFKPELTTNKEFSLSNGQKKSLPFMSLRSSFKCGWDTSIKSLVAVLPFQGEQYSLVLLLPQPNSSISTMLESLNGEKLADYQKIRPRDTLIEIPKFTARGNIDLYPIFNMMGITKIFSAASELTNIGIYRSASPQVSSAVHSAMMSVDERGATAAASTVVAAVALSYDLPSLIFRANRPFLAVLWDDHLHVPLFMTRIEDPSM